MDNRGNESAGVMCGVVQWGDSGSVGKGGCTYDTTTDQMVVVGLGGDVCGVVGRAGGDNFRGFTYGSWAYWDSVGVYAVTESIGDVFSSNDLTVRSYPAVRAKFVSGGILNSVVLLESFRVSIGSLAKDILGMVLGFFEYGSYGGNWCAVGDSSRCGNVVGYGVVSKSWCSQAMVGKAWCGISCMVSYWGSQGSVVGYRGNWGS